MYFKLQKGCTLNLIETRLSSDVFFLRFALRKIFWPFQELSNSFYNYNVPVNLDSRKPYIESYCVLKAHIHTSLADKQQHNSDTRLI